MVASRFRPKGGLVTPFGLSILAFVVAPSAIGSQDLAALVARQPAIAERPAPSRFSLISPAHGATFTMPRPVSAAMPVSLSYALAGLDTTYRRHDRLDPRAAARRGADRAGRRRGAGREPRAQGRPSAASADRDCGARPGAAGRSASACGGEPANLRSSPAPIIGAPPPASPNVAEAGAPEILAPDTVRAAGRARRGRRIQSTAWRSASASPARRPIRRS